MVPDIDIDHCGVGSSLKHYIGHEEVLEAAIEYREAEGDVWLDANDPGRPASRDEPPLTPAQVADLIRERPDLADVPYAEPLVFLAHNTSGAMSGDGLWRPAGYPPSRM